MKFHLHSVLIKASKKGWIALCFVLLSLSTLAQQDALFTHYMYNTQAINPAYAGSRDALTITGLHRSQWVGFDGAPITQTITLHSPLGRPELGVGLSLLNDQLGPSRYSSVHGDLSFTIRLKEQRKFSFGLKAGLNMWQMDLNSLGLTNEADAVFSQNVQRRILPNFGFGMYYHTTSYYIGVSTPRILQNNLTGDIFNVAVAGSERRHFYLIAGTVYELHTKIKFKPTTFVKVTGGAPVQANLTTSFIFNDRFVAGGMFRTGDALGVLVGCFINPQMEIGYSFDWSYGLSTGRYNGGSHEVVLRYDFIYKNTPKISSPRYF